MAFVRHIVGHLAPSGVRGLSRDEHAQAEARRSLSDVEFLVGDVRDRDRMFEVAHGTDIVVHAAALKRIDAGEFQQKEFIKTNVLGSINVLDAAEASGVAKACLLSTDKACRPRSVYGATKLLAERVFTGFHGSTVPVCVRYGNVLGSRGSVLDLFRQQAISGPEFTITDPAMTRFWMLMGRAVDTVLKALSDGGPGDIFVPRCDSFGILDLVTAIDPAMPVRIVGVRDGENIYETLVSSSEGARSRPDGDFVVISPSAASGNGQAVEEYRSDLEPRSSTARIRELLDLSGFRFPGSESPATGGVRHVR